MVNISSQASISPKDVTEDVGFQEKPVPEELDYPVLVRVSICSDCTPNVHDYPNTHSFINPKGQTLDSPLLNAWREIGKSRKGDR